MATTTAIDCVFEQRTAVCLEHSGRYIGRPACTNKHRGDRLDVKIEKLNALIERLEAKRDGMRNIWKRKWP